MLKYDPEGNLLWHKTWKDPINGGNCGATNVAIAIDNNDRIYWVANDWTAGGMWCGYMDTDGNLGLNGTAQQVLGVNYLNPTDIAIDNSGNFYLSGYNNGDGGFSGGYGIPTVVKVSSTGTVAWSSNVTPIASDSSTSTGIYRAVTVDPDTGSVWAIGDYIDGGNHWAMLSKWDSSGVNQWTNKLVTESGDFGEAVVFNSGYVYTVVNDGTENLVRVSKLNPDGTLVWASALAQGTGSKGYDLSFDVSGDVYLTGIYNNLGLWVTKIDRITGNLVYSRTLTTVDGEEILDGQGDPIVGHRAGDIYRDRIAVVATTQDSLTHPGSGYERIILAQLPLDGSIAGTFSNVTLADITSSISGISSTGTYTITTLSWTTGTYGTSIGTLSQLGSSVVTLLGQMSSQVLNISTGTRSSNWNFGSDGGLVFPDGTIQNSAWNIGIQSSLVNGAYTLFLGTDGTINLPNSTTGEPLIQSTATIQILANTSYFTFGTDGTLTVPADSTIKSASGNLNLFATNNVNIESKGHTFVFDTDTVGRFIMPPSGVIASSNTGNGLNIFTGNIDTEAVSYTHLTLPTNREV